MPGENVAVTELVAAVMVTLHWPVPAHAPDHPENTLGVFVVSVRVTAVFGAKVAEQVLVEPEMQSIPDGLLVTVPMPLPEVVTVKTSPLLKLAVTLAEADRVKLQVPVPEQPAPLQPPKKSPVCGAAVRVIAVFCAKVAEHVGGQAMPAGLLLTVPLPTVATVTP